MGLDLESNLTEAQSELYKWIKNYMKDFQHSPSIRQMMQAMGLKSPAPIQSRLKHLQEKGYISWQEGKARTLQIVDEILEQEDEALITAEKNLNRFAQWSLIFNKNHPILEKTIENLITNIHENKHKNNVLYFSAKPYWDAINSSFMENDLKSEG